jgi:pyruvate,water dikinase
MIRKIKARLTARRQAKVVISTTDNAEHLRQMYETFRHILATNDSVLQLIADIDDRLSGRIPFSFNHMVRLLRKGILDVYVMVRDFNELAWGRYLDLFDSMRRINHDFEFHLAAFSAPPSGPLIIPLSDLRQTDAPLVGHKMANLGEIRNVMGLEVPDGFAITATAFNGFMDRPELGNRAEKLEELTETFGARVMSEACRELQEIIAVTPLPTELENLITNAYLSLMGDSEDLVAVRSSGLGEDREASHAGLYATELNVDKASLLDSYRRVVASAYGAGPVRYRHMYGLSNSSALMAVGCIRMVKSRCQGVMFSRYFDDPEADKTVISAYVGPACDDSAETGDAEEVLVTRGIITSDDPLRRLSREEALSLAAISRKLEAHFGSPQDVEWAIDQGGRINVLQSRPMVFIKKPAALNISEKAGVRKAILAGGATAYPGVGCGKVFVLKDENELDCFPEGAVLVAHRSSPRYSRVMDHCSAIITEEGSPIGHMAILAREFQVPTIVGLKGALLRLPQGLEVTVDTGGLQIFEGLQQLPARPDDAQSIVNSPAVAKLKRIAQFITPLKLVDANSPEFLPSAAESLHDVIRFIHEKLFEVMFYFGDRALNMEPASTTLEENLPFRVLVFDLGGGLSNQASHDRRINMADVVSPPAISFLTGLSDHRISWNQPRALSAGGFFSVLGESIAGLPAEELGVGRPSFAVISDRYMNFSTKAGYHFNTVDTYCGRNVNKNYIHFRFEGGAADEVRRERRCRFISLVLKALHFSVQVRGDGVVARLEKLDRELAQQRLVDLGRITLCCRQLDMLMRTDSSPEFFAKAFLAGEFDKF